MLLCGIATNLRPQDIKHISEKIKQNNPEYPKEKIEQIKQNFLRKNFWPKITEHCVAKAMEVPNVKKAIKNKAFRKSSKLYDAIKNDFYAGIKNTRSDRKHSNLETIHNAIKSSEYIKNHQSKSNIFLKAAQTEYIAKVLFAQITYPDKPSINENQDKGIDKSKKDQVVPVPTMDGKLEMYKVNYKLSEGGYRVAILTIIKPKKNKDSHDAIVGFRGTRGLASVGRDLCMNLAPGERKAKKYGPDVLHALNDILMEEGIKDPKVMFTGNSLGASDAQNLMATYIDSRYNPYTKNSIKDLKELKIDLNICAAPGVSKATNELTKKTLKGCTENKYNKLSIFSLCNKKDPIRTLNFKENGLMLGEGYENILQSQHYIISNDKVRNASKGKDIKVKGRKAHNQKFFRDETECYSGYIQLEKVKPKSATLRVALPAARTTPPRPGGGSAPTA